VSALGFSLGGNGQNGGGIATGGGGGKDWKGRVPRRSLEEHLFGGARVARGTLLEREGERWLEIPHRARKGRQGCGVLGVVERTGRGG